MSNIIDSIQLSGVTYTLSAQTSGSSGGTEVVELTQSQYNALPTSAKTDATKLYVISDAQPIDFSQYWTSAETQSAITQAVSGKANSSDVYTKSETSGATQISTALNAKLDATAYTPTDLSNYYQKSETSGATQIATALSGKADSSSLATVATSGSYNDLTDKPTIPTVPTSNTAFTNDAGYLVANDITGKTDTSAFTAHTADTTIHTTSAEKSSWNGAATNASNAVTALGGLTLWKGTQAQYDAITNKDSNTIYFIKD